MERLFDIQFPVERDNKKIVLNVVGSYMHDSNLDKEEFKYKIPNWNGELTRKEMEALEDEIITNLLDDEDLFEDEDFEEEY